MSLLGKKWVIRNQNQELELLEKLLLNRELFTPEKRRLFFEADLTHLPDPFLLKDMQKAVDRIRQAISGHEKILIFGDYDIDGITGAALLYDFLKKAGANITYALPNREEDGYGLKTYFIERFHKEGVKFIITVDCGTSNKAEIERANELGLTVIVTDHHSLPGDLPPAYALINPHQPDCPYPNKEICGSTIAYKLVTALAGSLMDPAERQDYLMRQLSVVALGVIGDCMPLTEENRILVKYGLKSLRAGHNPGLCALLESAGLPLHKTTSHTLGFQVGPRLNAAGRVDKPDHAFHLILGDLEKAPLLNSLNERRRQMIEDYLTEAHAQISSLNSLPSIIVLYSPAWKTGLLGLIASRIAEETLRPTIVMQDRGEELVASCRSVLDFDITAFLRAETNDLFTTFGGHKMAGGFTLPKKHLESFLAIIAEKGRDYFNPDEGEQKLSIDCEVSSEELSLTTCERLNTLEPFGLGNPEPTLMIRNVEILSIRPVGSNKEHLQFPVRCGNKEIAAIAFRFGKHLSKIRPNTCYDIAFTMEVNEWNGNRKLQLKVVDLKTSE